MEGGLTTRTAMDSIKGDKNAVASSSHSDKPFVVLRFFETPTDDNQYFEVGLASWLIGSVDDDMGGITLWPPANKPATPLIKVQSPADDNWNIHKVQVMRFYETFVKARAAVPKFIEDSNYETEGADVVPKKRRRIRNARLDSSSEDEIPVRRQSKPKIPPAPAVVVAASKKSSSHVLKKGQDESKKKNHEELMLRLKAARAATASKINVPLSSPWKVTQTPIKNKSSESQHSSHCKKTPPNSPSPVTSPIQSGDFSEEHEGMDMGHFLAVEMSTGNASDCDTVELSEASPAKSPTVKSYSQLPRQNAFSLSPASARAVTQSLLDRPGSSKSTSGSGHSSNHVLSSNETQCINSASVHSTNVSNLKSRVDGRRKLFPVESKSTEERLEAAESGILSVEVLARENSSKLDLVLMYLSRVSSAVIPNEKRIRMPPGMPKLPLGSKAELQKFEDFLGENDMNIAAVCDYLSVYMRTFVPEPEKKSARNLLSHLMYNNLARCINLEGGNNKISFRSLNLYIVFQGTLKTAFEKSDLSIAESALKNWLKDAKWRKQNPAISVSPASKPSSNSGKKGGKSAGRGA